MAHYCTLYYTGCTETNTTGHTTVLFTVHDALRQTLHKTSPGVPYYRDSAPISVFLYMTYWDNTRQATSIHLMHHNKPTWSSIPQEKSALLQNVNIRNTQKFLTTSKAEMRNIPAPLHTINKVLIKEHV